MVTSPARYIPEKLNDRRFLGSIPSSFLLFRVYLRKTTMYTVSILSQTSRQWRSIQVKTLSECVQLTLGLSTDWAIAEPTNGSCDFSSNIETTKRYNHALRALVQRWKAKHFDSVACFRMSDSQLLAHIEWEQMPEYLKRFNQ